MKNRPELIKSMRTHNINLAETHFHEKGTLFFK
jgi:hypothetical protein